MLTSKERLTRAYLGQAIDRVPWTPMLYQWFHAKQYDGTLPPELDGCETPIDALRVMKADIFVKHEAFVVSASYSQCRFDCNFAGKPLRQPTVKTCLNDVFGKHGNLDFEGNAERHDRIVTPEGEITCSWSYREESGAAFEDKHYWEDFDAGYDQVRALLQDIEFVIDKPRWSSVLRELGDDGVPHLRIPPTPLKILHWLAGPEKATYFLLDHQDKILELVRIYEQKRLNLVKQVVSLEGTLVFTSGDNMDSMMYSPSIFEDYCGHSFRQIADVLHENGKLLFTHACGQLKHVIELCADSGLDGIEGMAPPPLGNLDFGDAREMVGPEFVLQGGMTYPEEEVVDPDSREVIFDRVQQIFTSLPSKQRFVYSSGCCPNPRARYENFIAMRDACWELGKIA